MPQTRPNGTKVLINSDGYNLAADLATMADTTNVVYPGNLATRNALVSPVAGATVARTDLTGVPLDIYDGGTWQDATPQPLTLYPTGSLYRNATTYQGQTPNPAQVTRIGRRVSLSGIITNNTSISFATNTEYTLATLPAGFAPAKAEAFLLEVGYTMCRIWVVPSDGTLRFNFATAFGPIASGLLFWSLSGMNWNS